MTKLISNFFWGNQTPEIELLREQVIKMFGSEGLYFSDNLISIQRNLTFLRNKKFINDVVKNSDSELRKAILWRLHTLCWAAGSIVKRKIKGDFFEVGAHRAETAKIIFDYVDFSNETNRRYHIFDLFSYDESLNNSYIPRDIDVYEVALSKFKNVKNINFYRGDATKTIKEAEVDCVALLHLDLNSRDAEIAVLEDLFPRMSPGGVVILDDYGWRAYAQQNAAETQWFSEKGFEVLELPTGQGLIFC